MRLSKSRLRFNNVVYIFSVSWCKFTTEGALRLEEALNVNQTVSKIE